MTRGYVDQNLIQNSTLACFLLTTFVRKYEELTAGTASPELMKILLVLPATWHRESCNTIRARTFSTPLHSVLADYPTIKSQFQERMAAFAPIGCQGLNLACATGLLRRIAIDDVPGFTTATERWPRGSKPVTIPNEMCQTVDRLATWFKDAPTARLYSQFLGI